MSMTRATAANSVPLASTSDSSAGPCPGRGAMFVAATKTAMTVGRATRMASDIHVLGRRNNSCSSTPITARPSSREHRALGHLEEDLFQRVPFPDQLLHAYPRLHEPPVEVVGFAAVDRDVLAAPLHHGAAEHHHRPVGVRRADPPPPGRPPQRGDLVLHDHPPAASPPARWGEERKTVVPAALSLASRSRISRMPAGSRPLVGSSRTSSFG